MTDESGDGVVSRRTARVALLVLALVVAGCLLVLAAGGTAAAQEATNDSENDTLEPYYGDESEGEVGNESWMEGNENATASSIFTYAGRVGSYVIGGDGSGSGPILTGMLLLGAMLGLVISVGVGMVGGGVLAVLALFGVVGVGLAPAWLLPVAIFGVGVLLSAMIRGMLR